MPFVKFFFEKNLSILFFTIEIDCQMQYSL